MVRIKKNGKPMVVSKSAFQNFYEGAGWKLDEAQVHGLEPEISFESEDGGDEWAEAEVYEDVEKPLSQMNHQELLDKAASIGVNANKNMSVKQLRELIRKNA